MYLPCLVDMVILYSPFSCLSNLKFVIVKSSPIFSPSFVIAIRFLQNIWGVLGKLVKVMSLDVTVAPSSLESKKSFR